MYQHLRRTQMSAPGQLSDNKFDALACRATRYLMPMLAPDLCLASDLFSCMNIVLCIIILFYVQNFSTSEWTYLDVLVVVARPPVPISGSHTAHKRLGTCYGSYSSMLQFFSSRAPSMRWMVILSDYAMARRAASSQEEVSL